MFQAEVAQKTVSWQLIAQMGLSDLLLDNFDFNSAISPITAQAQGENALMRIAGRGGLFVRVANLARRLHFAQQALQDIALNHFGFKQLSRDRFEQFLRDCKLICVRDKSLI